TRSKRDWSSDVCSSDLRLLAEVLQQIVTKTDGIPLFVEEVTKAVVESGLFTAVQDQGTLRGPLPALAIPTTLHEALMARLDRLRSEERRVGKDGRARRD